MVISNVDQLWMENITFEGCSLAGEKWEQNVVPLIEQLVVFFLDSPSVVEFLPNVVGKSLTIIGSHDITLCRVNVQNSKGVGLLALNMIGDSSLRDCVFDSITDIGCSESSNDPRCIASGAMIFIGDIASGNPLPNNNTIVIDNCVFKNSVSHSDYLSLELSDGVFRLNVSLGNKSVNPLDGSAGLSVLMARHHEGASQEVVIMNSQFLNNSHFSAGCMLIQVTEYTSHFNLYLHGNMFRGCSGDPYGGALFLLFGYKLQNSFQLSNNSLYDTGVNIFNNSFEDNSASWGGAIALIGAPGQLSPQVPRRDILISDNTFVHNKAISGFALAVWESSSHGYRRVYGLNISINGNWFEENLVINDRSNFSTYNHFNTGTMYIDSSYVTLTGDVVFYRNRGAILAARSVIEVRDTCVLNISENVALIGGGADLRDGSLFIIKDNATILFRRNFAPLRGGGINLLNIRGWPLQYRDGCIFYFNDFSYCPSLNGQACINLTALRQQGLVNSQVIFDNNTAGITGNAMYGVQLLDCPWTQFDSNNFKDGLLQLNHTIKFYPPLETQSNVINTPRVILELEGFYPDRVMPGQPVTAIVSVKDELGDYSPNEVIVELSNFSKNAFTIDGGSEAFVVERSSKVTLRFFGETNQYINFSIFAAQSFRLSHSPETIYLTECKPGFVHSNGSCVCDPKLLGASNSVNCSDNGTIIIELNYWAGILDNEYIVSLCYLQYCDDEAVEIDYLNDSEAQCNFNHAGLLCGSCSSGHSDVFGSSGCRNCSNSSIATLLLFAFLGIFLVALLFAGHITVSSGYFNGVILYANAVSLYPYLLYPNNYSPSRNPASVLIAWLNLNLGFELCFYDGMSSLAETTFRLLFPIYLLFLSVVIILVLRRTRSRLFAHPPVQVLCTILWLSYVSLFQTSVEVLGVVSITRHPSGHSEPRWLQDPTVHYGRGAHLVLVLIALLLMVLLLIPLPLVLLFYHRLTNWFRWLNKLHPFVDAFYGPFKLRHVHWISFRLLFRMGLVIVSHFGQLLTVSSLRQYFTLLLVYYICGLLVFQAVALPFKSFVVNLLDVFYLTNLSFLFISAMYFSALAVGRDDSSDSGIHIVHTTLSISLTLFVFGVVLLWHLVIQLREFLAKKFPKGVYRHGKLLYLIPEPEGDIVFSKTDTIQTRDKTVTQTVIATDEEESSNFVRMRESFLSEDYD
ncbi:uncharacterized protein [Dysidea avara]